MKRSPAKFPTLYILYFFKEDIPNTVKPFLKIGKNVDGRKSCHQGQQRRMGTEQQWVEGTVVALPNQLLENQIFLFSFEMKILTHTFLVSHS